MEPAAISARPAVTTMAVESMTPETPAARANGTVRPSAMPITMSRTIALAVKCCSTCGVSGMAPHILTISTAASRYPLAMPPEATILLGAALVFLGFVVGTFGTLIGAGGGFLLVPLLLIGYHFQPPDAVGTSLALVFLNAASGSFAYLRQRRVDLSLGWKFAAATIPGAIGGAYLTRAMSSHVFSFAFGALLILIAVLLFSGITAAPSARADARQIVDASGAAHVYHVDVWKGVIVSFVAGVLSSAFGIGGGIIHVPFLIVVLGLPVHIATATAVVFSLPPISQDVAYHQFADRRQMLGIPNALNVLSNVPFAVIGILGLTRVARAGAGWERLAFLVLFASVVLTGVGSVYYHLAPRTATLFWDRLPMTVAFASLTALTLGERVSPRAGPWLLAVLVVIGVTSVVSWQRGELAGAGDLRLYILVQFLPMVLIPLALVLFPARALRARDLLGVLGWYVLAKLFEALDAPIFALAGVVSGHTLKHLAAATATAWLLRVAHAWWTTAPGHPTWRN